MKWAVPNSAGRRYKRSSTALQLMLACVLLGALGCGDDAKAPKDSDHSGSEAAKSSQVDPAAPQRATTMKAVAAAPRPTGRLPDGASCVTPECHAAFGTSAQIHAPIVENACNACHDADTGKHVYPLKRGSIDATCGFCHVVSGTQSHQHAALKEGCTACHDPHASDAKFLIKAQSVEALCGKCHETSLQKFAHRPFVQGECTLCHQPHQAENKSLLRGGEVPEHCFQCHDDIRQQLDASATIHSPAERDCLKCHSPHTSKFPALMARSTEQTCLGCHETVEAGLASSKHRHAAIDDGRQCASCHNPHASNFPKLMADRMDRVCLTCHDTDIQTADGRVLASMKPVLTQSAFLHGAIKLGDCSACHRGHSADQPMLLVGAFPASSYARFDVKKYDLCFEKCHSPQIVLTPATASLTNFRNGEQNLHFVHVNRSEKGRSCKTCHAVHGSNLPNHMASEVPFERSGWAMPVGYQKQADGGSCSPGCHTPRSYVRSIAATQPSTQPADVLPTAVVNEGDGQ